MKKQGRGVVKNAPISADWKILLLFPIRLFILG